MAGLLVVACLLIVALGGSVYLLGRPSLFEPRRDREVLPAHYEALVSMQPQRCPGYCPDCGTVNEPGYQYCRSCGRAIPTTETPSAEDVDAILQQ